MRFRSIIAVLLLLFALVFTGCKSEDKTNASEPDDESATFTGTVLEAGEFTLLVEPDEGSWVRSSADKIAVTIKDARLLGADGSEIDARQILKGARVEISFTGSIAESYPAQIFGCYEVKLLSGEVLDKAGYKKISAEQAKDMMDSGEPFILLDVRTKEEFSEKRIDGAILIPDYEIKDRAPAELPDKDALILIYCRSGVRSANAAHELISMDYTNVYDFGGIIDWPYDTVSG